MFNYILILSCIHLLTIFYMEIQRDRMLNFQHPNLYSIAAHKEAWVWNNNVVGVLREIWCGYVVWRTVILSCYEWGHYVLLCCKLLHVSQTRITVSSFIWLTKHVFVRVTLCFNWWLNMQLHVPNRIAGTQLTK